MPSKSEIINTFLKTGGLYETSGRERDANFSIRSLVRCRVRDSTR